jgi:hypothetical protein
MDILSLVRKSLPVSGAAGFCLTGKRYAAVLLLLDSKVENLFQLLVHCFQETIQFGIVRIGR